MCSLYIYVYTLNRIIIIISIISEKNRKKTDSSSRKLKEIMYLKKKPAKFRNLYRIRLTRHNFCNHLCVMTDTCSK